MRHPDPKYIIKLKEKLEKYGDITEEEADKVYSLFSENCINTKLNPASKNFNPELKDSLLLFLETSTKLASRQHYGFFISSFSMASHVFRNPYLGKSLYNFLKLLPVKERIAGFNISLSLKEKLSQKTIEVLKTRNEEPPKKLYEDFIYTTSRVGFLRLCGLDKVFELCTDISGLAIDPFSYKRDKILYTYNYKKEEKISESRITADTVISFIEDNDIPHITFEAVSAIVYPVLSSSYCLDFDCWGILVDNETAQKINRALPVFRKGIMSELINLDIVSHKVSDSESYVYDYNLSDFNILIEFSRKIFDEVLRHGMIINQAREEEAEEDVWMDR